MTKSMFFLLITISHLKMLSINAAFHSYKAHFLIFIKYYLVIIQATKIFHYQMHQLIMMNSLTIPNGHT